MSQTSPMSRESQRDANDRRIAWAVTLVFHISLLLIALFTLVWQPPDPPIPQYGILVNFGTDDAGSGNIQNRNPANDNEQMEDAKPQPLPNEEQSQPSPDQPKIDPVATPTDAKPVEAVKTEDDNSPDVVEDKKIAKPQPESKPKPEGQTSNQGTSDKNSANNNGNVPGKVGDQGKPEGDLNADALLGGGGQGGASLDMAGWRWDDRPQVNDPSNETGKVVFEVKIDSEGEVISVKLLARSVSREVASRYEQAVYDLTFSPTANNPRPGGTTTGRIAFVITAK